MQPIVSYKAIVERIWNLDKHEFCEKFYDKPNDVDSDKIPLGYIEHRCSGCQ